jgi:hypothetical protein
MATSLHDTYNMDQGNVIMSNINQAKQKSIIQESTSLNNKIY